MSNRPTMAEMMAWRTAPMPLTMAMRHAPMVWKMDSIWNDMLALCKRKENLAVPEEGVTIKKMLGLYCANRKIMNNILWRTYT